MVVQYVALFFSEWGLAMKILIPYGAGTGRVVLVLFICGLLFSGVFSFHCYAQKGTANKYESRSRTERDRTKKLSERSGSQFSKQKRDRYTQPKSDSVKSSKQAQPRKIVGTGDNFGKGYKIDRRGNIQGTGDNFGSGWRRDRQGNLHGTGDNFGSGYRVDSNGNLHGTGKNFGKGWRRDRNGNLRGTGDNFGKDYRRDSNGNLQGSGKNFGNGWRER
jgi:hypothetical protein